MNMRIEPGRSSIVGVDWRDVTVSLEARFSEDGRICALGEVSFHDQHGWPGGKDFLDLAAGVDQMQRYLATEHCAPEVPLIPLTDLAVVLRNGRSVGPFRTIVNALANAERSAVAMANERRSARAVRRVFDERIAKAV